VLLQAIGAVLPAALAIALSPFPVIGIVLILAGPHGRLNGPLFAAGWLVGLAAVTTLAVVAFGGADDPDSTSSALADWGRVVAGVALIILGGRKWRHRPASGEAAAMPGWMASLDAATPPKAFGVGLALGGANPKNFVLSAAAATSMVEAGAEGRELVIAVVVFVLMASLIVVGAVVLRLAGGRWGASMLEAIRGFMVANSVVITVIVLILLGAKILGDGLTGLGR
jgi:threonine/homoserine/homoserine lactone efflux protein